MHREDDTKNTSDHARCAGLVGQTAGVMRDPSGAPASGPAGAGGAGAPGARLFVEVGLFVGWGRCDADEEAAVVLSDVVGEDARDGHC